jgi:WD40 repeat protein
LASGGDGVRLWRADGTLLAHSEGSRSGAFSPDGSRILTVDALADGGEVRLSDSELRNPRSLGSGAGFAVFSPDGTRIAFSNQGGAAIVSSDGDGPVVQLDSPIPFHLELNRDSSSLVASSTSDARLYASDGSRPPTILRHRGDQTMGFFSHDGARVLTIENSARIWKVSDPPGVRSVSGPRGRPLAVSPDGSLLFTASPDGTAILSSTDAEAARERARASGPDIVAAAFSPDGKRVAIAHVGGGLRLWKTTDAAPVTLPVRLEAHRLALSPDGRWLAAGRRNGVTIIATDGSTEAALALAPAAWVDRQGWPSSISFSPDGAYLVATMSMSAALLWRSDDWSAEPVAIRGPEDGAGTEEAAFHPRGTMLATGARSGEVQFWSLDGRERVDLARRGGLSVAFSPDGQRVASGLSDGSVRISRLDSSGETLVLHAHPRPVARLTFTPDGRQLMTKGENAPLMRLWLLEWDDLLAALGAATNACLTTDNRRRYFHETVGQAQSAWHDCERRLGR